MTDAAPDRPRRCALQVRGAVQGVGFRPYVVRLARRLALGGRVTNTGAGVTIEIEGPAAVVGEFVARLPVEAPPGVRVTDLQVSELAPQHDHEFVIAASTPRSAAHDLEGGAGSPAGSPSALQPDAAVCADCLAEVLQPGGRRFGYPFTTCASCGPRYTLAEGLPFDRERTTMRDFPPCAACAAEYEDPADRRFHAQTLCCPACGPSLTLRQPSGAAQAGATAALAQAAAALAAGAILAIKGVGGYHLMCLASDQQVVRRLRARKRRPDKPLAVMVQDLAQARCLAAVTPAEAALLSTAAAPIVLLATLRPPRVAPAVAGGVGTLGVLLAYTPLHQLLLRAVGEPLVATSGNLSDEPLCTEPPEARRRLAGIADLFLDHDRRIVRPLDDAVTRVMGGRPVVLRRGRGYTPGSLPLPAAAQLAVADPQLGVAVGGQGKCALAVLSHGRVHLGEHLGNLDEELTLTHWRRQRDELPAFLGLQAQPRYFACDAHPDYVSTRLVPRQAMPIFHHRAHALAALCDTGAALPALAVTWDGGGYGEDGTIWGGEMLLVTSLTQVQRLVSLRPFRLPGGEAAVREPRRAALGLLYALRGEALWTDPPPTLRALFSEPEWALWRVALARAVNAPLCSSIGRLFDAVAALLGLRSRVTFDGQAAMELEAAAAAAAPVSPWPLPLQTAATPWCLDPAPLIDALLADPVLAAAAPGATNQNEAAAAPGATTEAAAPDLGTTAPVVPTPAVAAAALRFHLALAESIAEVAQRTGLARVLLTGGVFQNKLLTEATIVAVGRRGATALWPKDVPPNDGGLAVGQVLAAAAQRQGGSASSEVDACA